MKERATRKLTAGSHSVHVSRHRRHTAELGTPFSKDFVELIANNTCRIELLLFQILKPTFEANEEV
jgi:hypothetical protein